MMLTNLVVVVGLSILFYWLIPKVVIDLKLKTIDEDVLVPSNDVDRISWNNAERKFQGKFSGPESITHDPITGDIYTGTADGMIWKMNNELTVAEPIIRIGEDHPECGSEKVEYICGRVLGLKFISSNKLIVVDTYRGIFAVHLDKRTKEILVGTEKNEMTKSLKFFNSVDVSKNGIVYFTVSSMKWTREDYLYSILEGDNTGRVYSYNILTQELNIIASNLFFPNGLTLTLNESSLIVCELSKRRLLKIDLSKSKENLSVFLDKLPGFPDNIKKDMFDNYYVAMPITDSITTMFFLHKHPLINYSVAWLLPKRLIMKFIDFNSKIYKIDNQGKIISIIDGTRPGTDFITEAYEVDNKIILGNLFNPYLEVIETK